jgi:toxin ParE1/3/4
MYSIIFTPEAETQMLRLFFYLAEVASPEVASRFTGKIMAHCETLATFPERGTKRDDLRPGLRVFGFRKRVSIVFDVTEDNVTIHGIYYGGQNFEASFRSEGTL